MEILNTKTLIEKQKQVIGKEIKEKFHGKPKLVIIQVEGDDASDSYVKNKIKIAEEVGIIALVKKFKSNVHENEIIACIKRYNDAYNVDGIIVQLPLPSNLNQYKIINTILPEKDVDGLTLVQSGRLIVGDSKMLVPCTALGVACMIKAFERHVAGKNVVIVNRSHLIGIPLQHILTRMNATVTVCHSMTRNLKKITRDADIVVTGTRCAKMFNHEYFRDGQMIIDCSMNYVDGKLCGDVDMNDEVLKNMNVKIASGKGHTGPMTVLSLMNNVARAKSIRY